MRSSDMTIEVDVWVRGTQHAETHRIESPSASAAEWDESHVRQLVSEMLLALNRAKHPGAEPPPVSLRGFSWIVSPYQTGVIVHIEMQIGTASAGPFEIAESRLTELLSRVMEPAESPARVH